MRTLWSYQRLWLGPGHSLPKPERTPAAAFRSKRKLGPAPPGSSTALLSPGLRRFVGGSNVDPVPSIYSDWGRCQESPEPTTRGLVSLAANTS
jgi:hypothetical protein